jgi:hypothetical protein
MTLSARGTQSAVLASPSMTAERRLNASAMRAAATIVILAARATSVVRRSRSLD